MLLGIQEIEGERDESGGFDGRWRVGRVKLIYYNMARHLESVKAHVPAITQS